MLFPLIVGLIVGFLARKFLKIAIIAAVVILIAAYLGFLRLKPHHPKKPRRRIRTHSDTVWNPNHRHTPVRHRLLCGSHNRVLSR